MSAGDLGVEVAERVLAELTVISRKPFQRQLAKLLGCAPSTEAISKFAEKNPDRWAQAVAIFAPLAGIQRDAPVQVNIWNVKDLSDAALLARAVELGVPLPVDMLPAGILPPAELGPEASGGSTTLSIPSDSQTGGDVPTVPSGVAQEIAEGSVADDVPERECTLPSGSPRPPSALPKGKDTNGS